MIWNEWKINFPIFSSWDMVDFGGSKYWGLGKYAFGWENLCKYGNFWKGGSAYPYLEQGQDVGCSETYANAIFQFKKIV